VQVKSGKVGRPAVGELVGTINRENAAIGVFLTLEEPTQEMRTEAAAAGFYRSEQWGRDYPRLQLLTVRELLVGAEVKMPPTAQTFKQARRERELGAEQMELGIKN
jgi:site-specific DNA-methyltransferase (adenine-specific)